MSSGVAVVTGAVQGLGAAISRVLLDEGYKVCLSDIQLEKGAQLEEEFQNKYGKDTVFFTACNVTLESDYARVFSEAEKKLGTVDVLVNNAGILREQDPQLTLQVNLMGPILGCQTALKKMGKSSGGRGGLVINVASLAGLVPLSAAPVYTATKHAVVGLTRSLGLPFHYEKEGVTFTALCPWFTDTPLLIDLSINTLNSDMNYNTIPALMNTDHVAKGISKILKDRINGSLLCVSKCINYQYVGYQEQLKDLPIK